MTMDELLQSSAQFEIEVIKIFELPPHSESEKIRLCKVMCSVAVEHAESFKILLASGNFTSSIGMLRSQFECFVRGVWVFYSASDSQISKLTAELNNENIKLSEKLPMVSQMIDELKATAPQNAIDPILEFKEVAWKPLNSYVHGGLHAIDRHSKGYPIKILEDSLKSSNGVNGLVAMFLAVLTGDRLVVQHVTKLYEEFSNCFLMKN